MTERHIEDAPDGEKAAPAGTEKLPITDGIDDWFITIANLVAEKIRSNGTVLTIGAVTDGEYLKRSGSSVISSSVSAGNGWLTLSALTYSSAAAPTFIVSSASDLSTILHRGMRITLQQSQAMTGYWSFNTNSTPEVGAFTCTDSGMSYTAGKYSNAATFNGSTSKITVTDAALLKPTGEFTVACWVKAATAAGNQRIYQSYSGNTNIAGFHLTLNTDGKFQCVIGKNTGTVVNLDYMSFIGGTNIGDNSWHHVALVFRNNFVQGYVDGKLDFSGYSVAPAYAATNYVRFGCGNATGADILFLGGQIDDFVFINGYGLDENTIRSLARSASAKGTGAFALDKYFLVSYVAPYSGGTQLISLYGGTDHSLANATISNPKYSATKVPFAFPANPDKWTVLFTDKTDRTQATPTAGTWYNLGSISISVPTGAWMARYQVVQQAVSTAAQTTINVFSALSTSNNNASDADLQAFSKVNGASGTLAVAQAVDRTKVIEVDTATTHYLIAKTSASAASIDFLNAAGAPCVITLTSAYL